MQELQQYFALRYMQPFHKGIIPNTTGVREFKEREFGNSYMWVKGRIIDDVEQVLAQWRQERNNNRVALPVCLMGVRQDVDIADISYAKSIATPVHIQAGDDSDYQELQMSVVDRSIQVVFVGATEAVTRSLVMQMCLYASRPENRRFESDYEISGQMEGFPCVIEDTALIPERVESEQKNISIHKLDIRIHESIPFVGKKIKPLKEISENESTIASVD